MGHRFSYHDANPDSAVRSLSLGWHQEGNLTMFQPTSGRRPRGRRVLALLAAVGAVVAATATMAAASPSTTGSLAALTPQATGPTNPHAQLDRPGETQHYAIVTPDCGQPTPGHVACLSDHLVRVAKGTPGAFAYTKPAASVGPAGGFTPADLASGYGFTPSAAAGANQTVAVVDAFDDPAALTELNAFDSQYGLPAETSSSFRKVNQSGNASPLPTEDDGWAGEIALDIEAVRGVCNKCHILLVETNSESTAALAAGVNTAASLGATEISNSYGGPESVGGKTTSTAAELSAYNHPGIVITASTGDHGWYDWDYANDLPTDPQDWSDDAPNVPAAYPTVVAVGGTALKLNSSGGRSAETVWNEDGAADVNGMQGGDQGASGGGCSTLYKAPSYQASVAGYAKLGCASGKRSTGDVAADADPATGFDVFDSVNAAVDGGDWVTVGGTSLSSPLISAMWALAGGSGGVADPARSLYDHFKSQPSSLFDVKGGGNAFCAGDSPSTCSSQLKKAVTGSDGDPNHLTNGNANYTNPQGWAGLLDCDYPLSGTTKTTTPLANRLQCHAAAGYDGPSGVGTPNGLAAFRPANPSIAATWPALVKRNTAATFRATGFADPVSGAKPASYKWTWGDGKTTTTTSATTTHRFTAQGRYAVSLSVVDSVGHTSRAVTKTFAVGFAPSVSASGPKSVRQGKSGTYTTKTSDQNTGGRITAYTWRIGTTVVGRKAKLVHRFTAKGTFRLTVTVTDNSGLTKKSNTVTIKVS